MVNQYSMASIFVICFYLDFDTLLPVSMKFRSGNVRGCICPLVVIKLVHLELDLIDVRAVPLSRQGIATPGMCQTY